MNYLINNTTFNKNTLLQFAKDILQSDEALWKKKVFQFIADYLSEHPTIEVQSSGTTGKPKVWQVHKEKMQISAAKTATYFNFKEGQRALLVLPVDYIAGKMMIVRALEHGLNLICKTPKADFLKEVKTDENFYFCPITPMQAKVSLTNPASAKKIKQIKHILLGGAPVGGTLSNWIKQQPNQYYHSYGMTETLSHIAIKKLNHPGSKYFQLLDDVKISKDERDCLVIDAPEFTTETLLTNDIIFIKDARHFEWLGRYDHVINSGGIKIIPETIETILQKHIDKPFYLSSLKDELLGEKLILLIETAEEFDTNALKERLKTCLPKHHLPKEIKLVKQFERTLSGKIKRQKL